MRRYFRFSIVLFLMILGAPKAKSQTDKVFDFSDKPANSSKLYFHGGFNFWTVGKEKFAAGFNPNLGLPFGKYFTGGVTANVNALAEGLQEKKFSGLVGDAGLFGRVSLPGKPLFLQIEKTALQGVTSISALTKPDFGVLKNAWNLKLGYKIKMGEKTVAVLQGAYNFGASKSAFSKFTESPLSFSVGLGL